MRAIYHIKKLIPIAEEHDLYRRVLYEIYNHPSCICGGLDPSSYIYRLPIDDTMSRLSNDYFHTKYCPGVLAGLALKKLEKK